MGQDMEYQAIGKYWQLMHSLHKSLAQYESIRETLINQDDRESLMIVGCITGMVEPLRTAYNEAKIHHYMTEGSYPDEPNYDDEEEDDPNL